MTAASRNLAAAFRQRFVRREPLIGSFVKTPTGHAILGDVGFDFVVLDQEHAPFDRSAIGNVLLAARAGGIAGIVWVATGNASNLLSALDSGAAGVLVAMSRPSKARDGNGRASRSSIKDAHRADWNIARPYATLYPRQR
jgi:2-keto-3-deoxy-L-rhamnonate aldolase RhmA